MVNFKKYCGLLTLGFILPSIIYKAQAQPSQQVYNPIAIEHNRMVQDILSPSDIPTGEGGFARDFFINLKRGDQIVIDVTSEEFDTVVVLMKEDGSTVGENDDAPDGTTNSLLFTRIMDDGKYIIRVSSFALSGNGSFNLRVTKLQEEN
ncbi:PPC domain-containing protein [Cyanobacterium stanieri LEGE 03274]|uniref:PPC domain-containing protein n=1 Tax=Cyanobacterium stanieri LEGE 03274 TaxID=1828756 RepID=A0ABR9UZY5_9CHRO|nr:pre-peptidase C-terminal domain-containing protein [Cyanobacterium stanieri]MBE9221177.1 PPC domain-containing protein [Cyanobacterium stanieri LEGE 03274]